MAKGQKTGGRVKGSRNKRTESLLQELEQARAQGHLSALQFLQRIYRDEGIDLATRLVAAGKAINYETPALAATRLDASEGLTRVAQMLNAAAQGFDEKINAIAANGKPAEDAAGEPVH
jgi:hypothetical protein